MRLNMVNSKQVLSILIIISLTAGVTWADKTTAEKIRKHQEWLKQRNRGRKNALASTNQSQKSLDLFNVWRFDRQHAQSENDPSINDVYPENERILQPITTTTSTTTTTQIPTTTTSSTSTTPRPTYTTTTTTTTRRPTTTTRTPTTIRTTRRPTTTTTTAAAATRYSLSFTQRPQAREWLSNDILYTTTPLSTTTASTSSSTTTTTTTTPKPITTTTTTTTTRKPRQRPYPRWNNWNDWSDCSRSCGGGVRYQTRRCVNKNSASGKLYLSKNCFGIYKRFQLCNEKPCPSSMQNFRAEQCSAYDEVDFQGRQYKWEPYIKDDAECELNCKPIGMKYFATLNDTVIDGTPCEKPAEYYRGNFAGHAMCIEGICKAVHAGGLIAGIAANSGAVACGGLLCRPLTGLYTRDPLPEDAYIHVAMIPAGASNISITELKNSMNLLVLRTEDQKYVFNGDNTMSESGTYEAAGAIFDYHRLDSLHQGEGVTEWVTCTGPVRESLELMIYSKTVNPGIKYEYLLPITSDSEENEVSVETDGFLKSATDEAALNSNRPARRRRYNWKVVGFSTCSKSCGGGIQSPVIKCVRENPLRYYSQRRCVHSEKPVINENLLRCNTQPCPAYWRTEDWGECRCHHPNDGIRERETNCVQELASGIVVHVDETACMEEKPLAKKPCDCPKNKRRSNARYRMHGLSPNVSHTQAKQTKAGIWLMSDWNQYCSSECGPGMEYRTVFCDRTKSNPDRCDFRFTPDTSRICESEQPCETGEWFAGPWSPCNGNCFNLTRTRQVLCIENQLILEEEDCKSELKPATMEKCSHDEIEYCGPRWHYSEWSECTKTCDGGTQRRSVKCLEYNDQIGALKESNKCRYSIREPIYRSCNTHKCEDLRYDQIQNDETFIMPCTDAFTNCAWAVKAKLCTYEYYKQKCCYSCSEAQ